MSLKIVRSPHARRLWQMITPGIEEYRAGAYREAFPLLLESAIAGFPEAQCMLGNMYQLGLGEVETDAAQAIHWYYQSANQGYSVATSNLAGMIWPISREAAAALNQLAQQQGFVPQVQAS